MRRAALFQAHAECSCAYRNAVFLVASIPVILASLALRKMLHLRAIGVERAGAVNLTPAFPVAEAGKSMPVENLAQIDAGALADGIIYLHTRDR